MACARIYTMRIFTNMSHHIANLVRNWRATLGLKQEAAAATLGISQGNFSRVESGRQLPDRSTARKFVDAGVFTAADLGEAMVANAGAPSEKAA